LFQGTNDDMVREQLQYMLGSVLAYLQVVKEKYLPGGELWDPDDETLRIAESVPKHTDTTEGCFAGLESLLQRALRMAMMSAQGQVLIIANKTMNWLAKQNGGDRASFIKAARLSVPALEKTAAADEKEGRVAAQAVREQQLALADQKEAAHREERGKLADALEVLGGQWKTEDEIDAGLVKVAERLKGEKPELTGRSWDAAVRGARKAALVAQLQGWQKIRKVQAPVGNKTVFQKSACGKEFDIPQLTRNLLSVLTSGRQADWAVGELDENWKEIPGAEIGRRVRTDEERRAVQERHAEKRRVGMLPFHEQQRLAEEKRRTEAAEKEAAKRVEAQQRAEVQRLKAEAAAKLKQQKAAEREAAKEKKRLEKLQRQNIEGEFDD
jgi:hypothetical protein